MGVLVEPKVGSYVNEWEAVRFIGQDFAALKKLMRNTEWLVQLDLTDEGAQARCTKISNGQIQEWKVIEGWWVVRSPHGYFWFMDEEEFRSQFMVWT